MGRIIIAFMIFVLTLIVGLFVFRKDIKLNYKLSYYVILVFISLAISALITFINPNNYGNVVVYFVALVLLPYVKASRDKAKKDEETFKQIIILCNDVASDLKQNFNVYHSLQTSLEDITNPLRDDVIQIMDCLQDEKEVTIKAISRFRNKYNFCILKQLGILMMQFHYDNNSDNAKILDTFQDDINILNETIKENQSKRKLLRFQYFALSIGSCVAMYFLSTQLKSVFTENVETFSTIIQVFYILILIVLFVVDIYFNNHISKE